MNRYPADQETRDLALTPTLSCHLEAPAGSGKTSVLLARYLNLLTTVGGPEEILALTFTRKAAGELKTRAVRYLLDRETPGPDASAVERLLYDLADRAFWHLDRLGLQPTDALMPERLQIFTFHALCARLLTLAPHEAGLPLEFSLLEGPEAEWLKEEALEELRRRLTVRSAADPVRQAFQRRLVRLNNDWGRLAGELRQLISRRDCLAEFLALAHASRDLHTYREFTEARLGQLLAPDLQALSQSLAASRLGHDWDGFLTFLKEHRAPLGDRLPRRPPGTGLEAVSHWQALAQALLTKEGTPRKVFSGKDGFPPKFGQSPWAQAVRELSPDFAELLFRFREIPPPLLYAEEVSAVQDLVILLGEALAVYEEICRQRRVLDFIALEEATLRLLEHENPSELLFRLDCRFRHLLVDEFQDTSERQKQLLCRLLEGWEGGAGRTLTVVGDPKQSIYGWRDAKVELFLSARTGLPCDWGRFPLKPLSLTTNFRATRRLITWVNQVFGHTVLRASEGLRQVPFAPADPAPFAPEGEPPELMVFLSADSKAARQAEARWLAAQVASVSAALAPGETVGILLFARTHLVTYLTALKEAGLAVRVKEGLHLRDSRVVEHLHNLARALSHPHDDLAWATLLTGPWAAQPLAVVAQAAALPGRLWPQRLASLAEEPTCPLELRRVLEALMEARAQTGRRPLEEVVREFLDLSGAWQGIASLEGPLGVANARAYLDLLAQVESALPEATWRKADFQLTSAYQPPDPRAQDSPVELMTVHGAKGLEFDWVFLPFLDWRPLGKEEPPPYLLEEIPGSGLHALALAPPYWQSEKSLLYQSLRRVKDAGVLAEARRVFYVAATRARKRLFCSAVLDMKKNGEPRLPAQSPLTWLWQHYKPEEVREGRDLWPQPDLKVTVCRDWPAAPQVPQVRAPLPDPWRLSPEPAPYRLSYPSQAATQEAWSASQPSPADQDSTDTWWPEDRNARIRGELLHRLLEHGLAGRPLPQPAGVAAALRTWGLSPEETTPEAVDVLREAATCLADPVLARWVGKPGPEMKSEWLLEDLAAPEEVRRGRLDLLVREGDGWLLLDFKSARPPAGSSWEDFLNEEARRYRPQLLAYREMAARRLGIPPTSLKMALYFTACRRLVEME